MKSVTDDAVVVGLMDYREADRIVTFFTRDHGRLSGIARGARRSVKRFGGALELFARLNVSFAPADGMVAISDVDIVSIFPTIRTTLAGIAQGGYACELVAAMAPERLVNQRLFRLLVTYLEHLDTGSFHGSDRHFFEMNLLNILGYRPPIENCRICGAPLLETGGVWSGGGDDGITCNACSRGGMRLGGDAIANMQQSLTTGRFGRIRFQQQELAEVEAYLQAFITSNLSRPLKSLAFMRLSP